MDNADAGKMGKSGIVQVFVQGGHGLVHCLAQQVDLRAYREGFSHLHLSLSGPCMPFAV